MGRVYRGTTHFRRIAPSWRVLRAAAVSGGPGAPWATRHMLGTHQARGSGVIPQTIRRRACTLPGSLDLDTAWALPIIA